MLKTYSHINFNVCTFLSIKYRKRFGIIICITDNMQPNLISLNLLNSYNNSDIDESILTAPDINTSVLNKIYTIRVGHYILLIIIGVLLILYILKNKNLMGELIKNGLTHTLIKFPGMSIISFISNLLLVVIFISKNTLNILNRLSNDITLMNEKNEKLTNNVDVNRTEHTKHCETTLDELFVTFINDFQNDDINNSYDSPLAEYINIDDTRIDTVLNKFEKEYSIKLDKWKSDIDIIYKRFAEKYKKYKEVELKLLEIKTNITELKDWTKTTEDVLEKYKDDDDIKQNIKNYVINKVTDLNYPNLIMEYQNLYLELKVLMKFLRNNPEIESISKCPICIINPKNSIIVPCGHSLCKSCLDQQYKIDKKIICPICRQDGTSVSNLYY